jgi:hypothetical protein
VDELFRYFFEGSALSDFASKGIRKPKYQNLHDALLAKNELD